MPLYSDHIANMYYSGSPSYSSAPYSYSSSVSPLGSSYSASYLNPGGSYSSHSSISSYSRTPITSTSRWTTSSGRNYSPILTSISERGTSSPVRINSPRRIHIPKRSYVPKAYTPRPININTADIDVSRDKYHHKVETPVAQSVQKENFSPDKDDNPFMPRVDGKPETGIDSSPGHQRSTIKRGRTVVRLHTLKRKERDSPRKAQTADAQDIASNDTCSDAKVSDELEDDDTQKELNESISWRDKLSDDLVYKDKREKKSLGTKLVEKFIVKDKDEDLVKERDIFSRQEKQIQNSPPSSSISNIEQSSNKSPDRRCSIEMLAEQAIILDSLIKNENLSIASLDLSKVGVSKDSGSKTPQLSRQNSDDQENQLQTTKSDHSLHNTLKSFKERQLYKKRSLRKSHSGSSLCRSRLDSITEFTKENILTELPAIEENRISVKRNNEKEKPKAIITSSVEVSDTPPKSPLKFIIENITVEEIPRIPRKEFTYSVIEEDPVENNVLEKTEEVRRGSVRCSTKRKTSNLSLRADGSRDAECVSPEPDDGNFWSKIGKRETVYLLKRKEFMEEHKEKNRRALFWFPEDYDDYSNHSDDTFIDSHVALDNSKGSENDTIMTKIPVSGCDFSSEKSTFEINKHESCANEKNTTIEPEAELNAELSVSKKDNEQDENREEQSLIINTSNENYEAKTSSVESSFQKHSIIDIDKTTTKVVQETNSDNKAKIRKKSVTQIAEKEKVASLKKTKDQEKSKKGPEKNVKQKLKPGLEKMKSTSFIKIKKSLSKEDSTNIEKCIPKEESAQNIESTNKISSPPVENIQILKAETEIHISKVDLSIEPTIESETIKTIEIITILDLDPAPEASISKESENMIDSKASENNEKVETVSSNTDNIPNKDTEIKSETFTQKITSGEDKKAETIPVKQENQIKKLSIKSVTQTALHKKPVKEEAATRPLIATPRSLQKKVPQVIQSSSSSDSSSESNDSDEETESGDSEDSTEYFECENNPDGRTSTGSNDSGFDSSAPTSPATFMQIKKGGDNAGPSSGAAQAHVDAVGVVEQELEQSTAYGLFRKTGRFTPPARSIPRFRKYIVDDFNFIKVLGKGSFGKVLLAELRDTEYYYAVKCLKKDVVLEDDDVECTLIERKVLALGTNHPYLCHLFATFQTESHLFFVMEYLNGGDLMFHIQRSGRFPEARARFYAAEIVSGLKFLHKRGIVYRDLKLDNILLDFDGHVRIADFGMCKLQIYLEKTADTFCGTPDYMAPEIIKGLKYNQTVDWWSFGVLLYEMLIGQSPFSGCDEDELFWSICNEMPSYPRFLSPEALSILTRLLDKDARTRLGGTECMHGDVREQSFFSAIHWDRLERRDLDAPFKPRVRHPMDTQYFDKAFTGERPRLTAVEPHVLRSMDQESFRGFSYTNPNATDR